MATTAARPVAQAPRGRSSRGRPPRSRHRWLLRVRLLVAAERI